jgi:nucleotide-binding universal stress UspA family protein
MATGRRDQLERVVVGVDASGPSRNAATWAAGEAEARDVPLTLVHALGQTEGIPPALGLISHQDHRRAEGAKVVELVAGQVQQAFPRLAVDTDLSAMAPADCLADWSTKNALVVTGTRGHGGLVGAMLGSVSRESAKLTLGPLVMVPQAVQAEEAGGPVVLGIGARAAPAAAYYAFAAARRYGTSVHAVRARQPQPYVPDDVEAPTVMPAGLGLRSPVPAAAAARSPIDPDEVARHEQILLDQALGAASEQFPEVEVGVSSVEGDAGTFLAATSETARLVVVGRHPRRALSFGPGYVAERLMARSAAPVAVVPEPPA